MGFPAGIHSCQGADRIRTGGTGQPAAAPTKVYRRNQNPVTVTKADGTVEVVHDRHDSTPERRQAEDKHKRKRRQKWLANEKRKKQIARHGTEPGEGSIRASALVERGS
jgi:hypothetical protein